MVRVKKIEMNVVLSSGKIATCANSAVKPYYEKEQSSLEGNKKETILEAKLDHSPLTSEKHQIATCTQWKNHESNNEARAYFKYLADK